MYSFTLSLTSVLGEGGRSTPPPGRFTRGKGPAPTVQETQWTPRLSFWTGAGKITPTGFRQPDLPARGESLYRLSYRRPTIFLAPRLLMSGATFVLALHAFMVCTGTNLPLHL